LDLKDSPRSLKMRNPAYIFGEAVIAKMAAYFPELKPPRGPFA
jgi:hypothetical protein